MAVSYVSPQDVMDHRYGRHGPDAWRRKRQRRFQRYLPAVVVPFTVVRIQMPVNEERIILIVVTSPNDDFNEHEPIQIGADQPRALQPVSDNSSLTNRARIQAREDVEDIKALSKKVGPVTIIDEDVVGRAQTLAREVVMRYYAPDNLDFEEHTRRKDRYQKAYLDQFEQERRIIAKDLRSFPDAKAANLARKARQDRKTISFPSSGRGPYHQRDLAVVSALHELGLCQPLEEYLEKIHVYVDIYEEAFRNPREKEVEWPDPASF